MTKIRVGTFNAENFFLRYKFLGHERGSMGKNRVDPSKFIDEGGNINMLGFDIIDDGQRKNTARAILANDPDVVCLQEIENLDTLKQFNSKYLKKKYPYSLLITGNDLRMINVGILSKLELAGVQTHQFDKDGKGVVFSRDCLAADVFLDKGGEDRLTLFVNHLKSQLKATKDENPDEKRERQATRISGIVEEHFKDLDTARFLIVGDMNDSPEAECLKPLLDRPWVENVVKRLPQDEQWTYYYSGKKQANQYDYLLLSKMLVEKNPDSLPIIERRGLADYVKAYTGERFPGVGAKGTEASDHCPVFVDLEV
jgi:predicted extracellular nuclease